jgi:ribonuclease HI
MKRNPQHAEIGDLFGSLEKPSPKASAKSALSLCVITNKKVVIHSDGGCWGNPGPGAWSALIRDGAERIISGSEKETTNNRMELMGAIQALRVLDEPCDVQFYTDSQYLRNGISTWIHNWKRRGWMTKGKEPVKNQDLWQALDRESERHNVTWHWEKGHVGNRENELCDQACQSELAKMRNDASATGNIP